MADNPAAAALAEVRELHDGIDCVAAAYMSAGDVPRLLKALEKARSFHQPVQLHELAFAPDGSPRCGHDPDTDPDGHYEGDDGEWYCKDLPPLMTVCSTCVSDGGAMALHPCDEYTAILTELTGKEAGDDR